MRTFTFTLSFSAFVASVLVRGHPIESSTERRLPARWFHEKSHPVHALFRRGDNGEQFEEPGSPAWTAAFPQGNPRGADMPQPWRDALKAAEDAGKIPTIPRSTSHGGDPVYPRGSSSQSEEVCSTTAKCRMPDDIWDAPPGVMGTGFDDGPIDGSHRLYDFLEEKEIGATHFMIGEYIRQDPATFLRAFNLKGSDIAVHTYTHRYMTTLSNEDAMAELAWTMQIIHDTTGGRVPRYWRPPYGDADNRIRAIARDVLGLQIVMWNRDTSDWSMGQSGGTTMSRIARNMQEWISADKETTGLLILHHELTNDTSQAFIDAVPEIERSGWKMVSQARMADNGHLGGWQNAADNTGDVNPQSVGASAAGPAPTSSPDDSTSDEGDSDDDDGSDEGDSDGDGSNGEQIGISDGGSSEGNESGSISSLVLPTSFSLFAVILFSFTFA